MSVLRAFAVAVARVLSNTIGNWTVITAATPNVVSWVAPQKCKIVAITFFTDVKTAITALSLMAELDGANILSAVVDANAGAVRTALPGVLTNTEGVDCPKDGVVTLDVDALTGTNVSGVQMQIDWIPVD
jgi:hypothetical protein